MLRQMSIRGQQLIGSCGRYIIFAGIGILASALTLFVPFESVLSPMLADYARIGIFIITQGAVWFLYDVCPQRIVIPFGTLCWIVALILVYVRIARDS